MNYKKIYTTLIMSRQLLGRKKNADVYFEKHHVLPKCLGGTNANENTVLLTAKEHFIAHLLLTKCYTGEEKSKMTYALFQMFRSAKNHRRFFSQSSYQSAKEAQAAESREKYKGRQVADTTGLTVWNAGKKTGALSPEHKAKIGRFHKGKVMSEQTRKKMSESAIGKQVSDSMRAKISKIHKGKIMSADQKAKIAAAHTGKKRKPFTAEARANMSKSGKGRTPWNKGINWLKKNNPNYTNNLKVAI